MEKNLSLVDNEYGKVQLPTKRCPVCGQLLFADMDVCYGCLHDFRRRPSACPPGFPLPFLAGPLPASFEADAAGELDEPRSGVDVMPEPAPSSAGDAPPPVDVATEIIDVDAQGGDCYLRLKADEVDADIEVGPQGLLVGRSRGCDVVLRSRSVSRRHVLIRKAPRGLTVEDQGATNPARIDGIPLEGSVTVVPGQTLEICGVTFTVRRHVRPCSDTPLPQLVH